MSSGVFKGLAGQRQRPCLVREYEHLEEARAKRAEKEAPKEAKGKGKRGRKRKSAALEAPELSNKADNDFLASW